MTELTIEDYVNQKIELMQQQGLEPVAVMLGHEDWLSFSVQSKVAYTPFGSARRYQPALDGLLLVAGSTCRHARRTGCLCTK